MILGFLFQVAWKQDPTRFARSVHARAITSEDSETMLESISRLAEKAGIPTPQAYVTDDERITASFVGGSPRRSAIMLSSGAIKNFDAEEMNGALAHEISHIHNHDGPCRSIVRASCGLLLIIGYMIIHGSKFTRDKRPRKSLVPMLVLPVLLPVLLPWLWLARILIRLICYEQEYRADAEAARLLGGPDGLIRALVCADESQPSDTARPTSALAMLLDIMAPMVSTEELGRTLDPCNPPLKERIRRLKELQEEQVRKPVSKAKSAINNFQQGCLSVIRNKDKLNRRTRLILIAAPLFAMAVLGLWFASASFKTGRLFSNGMDALKSQKWKQADDLFTQTRQYYKDSERYTDIGHIYYNNSQFELAYKYYKIKRPSDCRYAFTALLAMDLENAFKEAELAFRRDSKKIGFIDGWENVLSKHDKGVLRYVIGRYCHQQNDIPDAAKHYSTSLKLLNDGKLKDEVEKRVGQIRTASKEADKQYELAWDEFKQKNFDKAYVLFEKVYASSSDSTRRFRTRLSMGYCKRSMGDWIAAKKNYLEVLPRFDLKAVDKEDLGEIYSAIARGFWAEDDWKNGIEYANKAYEVSPENCSTRNQLAWYLIASKDKSLNRPHEALEIATETVRMKKGQTPNYLDTLAGCCASVCDFEKAVFYSQKAVVLARDNGVKVDVFEDNLKCYQNGQVPWNPADSSVAYSRGQWLLVLDRHGADLDRIKKYAPSKWESAVRQVNVAEGSKDSSIAINAYRDAIMLLKEGGAEIRKPSFIRFDTGSPSSEIYELTTRKDCKCIYLGNATESVELSPFKTHILEVREPKRIWYKQRISIDKPNHNYGTRTIKLEGRPDGGDTTATTWVVVSKRIVKNIYTNGDSTFTDKDEKKMWVYNPTLFGKQQWDKASEFCRSLEYGGYSDWKLPSQSDLKQLSSTRRVLPVYNYKDSMDPSKIRAYWTAEVPWNKNYAYVVTAGLRTSYSYGKTNAYGVFPMRRVAVESKR
jgi:heat shock protein HtpX